MSSERAGVLQPCLPWLQRGLMGILMGSHFPWKLGSVSKEFKSEKDREHRGPHLDLPEAAPRERSDVLEAAREARGAEKRDAGRDALGENQGSAQWC